MSKHTSLFVRSAGIALGAAIALAVFAAWQVPTGSGVPRSALTISVAPSAELAVEPVGQVLRDADFKPGRRPRGSFRVLNLVPVPVAMRVRALPSIRDLDRIVLVRVTAAGSDRPLFAGPLAALRRWSPGATRIERGRRARIEVRAWIPRSARSGWQGRVDDVGLQLQATPLGGGSR